MRVSPTWDHEVFDDLLDRLVEGHRVGKPRVADVLLRLLVARSGPIVANAPDAWPSQSEIARGDMLGIPFELPQDAVSRAVSALGGVDLVHQHDPVPGRPGRPYRPVELGGKRWAMLGVKLICDEHQRAERAHILATGLDGQPIVLSEDRPDELEQLTVELSLVGQDNIAKILGDRIEQLCELGELRDRLILGVGVEVAGHTFDGDVDGAMAGQPGTLGLDLGRRLSRRLDALTSRLLDAKVIKGPHPFPVLVDNDLHALGVLETYQPRYTEFDWLVAAVFDNGIGSAPIIGGRVYRGSRGMSGEIGHLTVPIPVPAKKNGSDPARSDSGGILPGFSDPCYCKRDAYHHLDCYATPVRILGELGETRFSHSRFAALANADAESDDGQPAQVFARAGAALGIALASVINLYDPSRVLLYLPEALAEPKGGSNAERYLSEAYALIDQHAFSDSAQRVKITPKSLPASEYVYLGAKAAAVRVVDSLIQHARGRCRCVNPAGAPGTPPAESPPVLPIEDLVSLRG